MTMIEPTKLTNFIDKWNIYPGFVCGDYDYVSSVFNGDPNTQISSLQECIEHCETFDDCEAVSFYDYNESDKISSTLTVCYAHLYCDDHSYDGEWNNGVIPQLAILARND